MVSSLSGLKLQAIYRIALSFETSEIPLPITIPTQLSNNQTIWATWHTKFCNMSRTFKITNQVYKLTWNLSVTSFFYNVIASSYGKLDKVKKNSLNILTHKSRWIGSWLCSLFSWMRDCWMFFHPQQTPTPEPLQSLPICCTRQTFQ